MFILLVNIFNHTFNLFINNIVRKPIIDESLFYAFYLFVKYCFGGRDQFGTEYVDRKCLLCSTKFIYIYIYIYLCVCLPDDTKIKLVYQN